jgi:hypothetical protein
MASETRQKLLQAVRAGFVSKGTSLSAYCETIGVDASYARKVVLGRWNGPAGLELIDKLLAASGANPAVIKDYRNEHEVA